jgi:hypothetical protein
MGGVMAHPLAPRRFLGSVGRLFEHAAVVVVGFVLMVVGLGLGVTIIMLPVGLVIGFIGMGLFVAGLFARFNQR